MRTYLDGVAEWLRREFDVDKVLPFRMALALEHLRRAEACDGPTPEGPEMAPADRDRGRLSTS